MANTDAELLKVLKQLKQTMQSAGGDTRNGFFGGTSTRPDDDKRPDATNMGDRTDRRLEKAAVKGFSAALKTSSSIITASVKNMKDFDSAAETLSIKNEARAKKILGSYIVGDISQKQAQDEMEKLGLETRAVNMTMRELSKSMEHSRDIHKQTQRDLKLGRLRAARDRNRPTARNTHKVAATMASLTSKGSMFTKVLGRLGPAGLVAADALKQVAETASKTYKAIKEASVSTMETGLKMDVERFAKAGSLGMSATELAQHIADHRQAVESSGMSMGAFIDQMHKSKEAAFHLGLGLQGSAKFFGKSMDAFTQMVGEDGNNPNDRGHFLTQQIKLFQKLKSTVNTTEEEFATMRTTLLRSSSIQRQLLKLDTRQRANKFVEMQTLAASLKIQGMSMEAATSFADKLAEISGSDTKTRIESAARAESVFGAVGLGAQGSELAKEIRLGARGNAARIGELTKLFRTRTMAMQQSDDLGTQMIGDVLTEKSGLGSIMKDVEQAIYNSGREYANSIETAQPNMNGNATSITGETLGINALERIEQGISITNNLGDVAIAGVLSVVDGISKLNDKTTDVIDGIHNISVPSPAPLEIPPTITDNLTNVVKSMHTLSPPPMKTPKLELPAPPPAAPAKALPMEAKSDLKQTQATETTANNSGKLLSEAQMQTRAMNDTAAAAIRTAEAVERMANRREPATFSD